MSPTKAKAAPAPAPAPFSGFPKEALGFLAGLERNNEKEWFDEQREVYERALMEPAKALVAALAPKLKQFAPTIHAEPRVNGSIMRMNRDVRFSKDKSPYKTHLDLIFWHGAEGRGWETPGFFFRLRPKSLLLGAGMHSLEGPLLERYRKAVADPKRGADLVKLASALRADGYDVGGEHYKRPPAGYEAEGDRARFLLHAGLYAGLEEPPPRAIHSAAFVAHCAGRFRRMKPLFDWLIPIAEG